MDDGCGNCDCSFDVERRAKSAEITNEEVTRFRQIEERIQWLYLFRWRSRIQRLSINSPILHTSKAINYVLHINCRSRKVEELVSEVRSGQDVIVQLCPAIDAATTSFHCSLSAAMSSIVRRCRPVVFPDLESPARFKSSSTLSIHFFCGLPLVLFPSGCHRAESQSG